MSEQTSVFEESPGVRSSKRVAGVGMIAAGGGLLIACGVVAMVSRQPMPNAEVAVTCGEALITAGGLLLGSTVIESFAK